MYPVSDFILFFFQCGDPFEAPIWQQKKFNIIRVCLLRVFLLIFLCRGEWEGFAGEGEAYVIMIAYILQIFILLPYGRVV
jgi:hypothetical protein